MHCDRESTPAAPPAAESPPDAQAAWHWVEQSEPESDTRSDARRAFGWIATLGWVFRLLAVAMLAAAIWTAVSFARPASVIAMVAGACGALAVSLALRALHTSSVAAMTELLDAPEDTNHPVPSP